MKGAFGTVVSALRLTGALVWASLAAFPALADVYKCKSSDGAVVYQEAPCKSSGTKLTLPEQPVAPAAKTESAKRAAATNKAMNDAFQSRMDKGDYEGALAFAINDKQKALARKKKEEQAVKCQALTIKAKKAQADFQQRGVRWQPAADAADAEYRLHCR